MKKELQEQLYEKYPKIFRQKDLPMTKTAMCWGISCGDGWYNIIDSLCNHIQRAVDTPMEMIKYYEERLMSDNLTDAERDFFQDCLEEQKRAATSQIEAVQVKEKYGTLRFYTNITTPTVSAIISFANTLSSRTCEKCGKPGELGGKGWVMTLCSECRSEQ